MDMTASTENQTGYISAKTWPPRVFYRYERNPEYALDIVKNRQLYHATVDQFNDPFDCRPLTSLEHSTCCDENLWRKFLDYYARMIPNITAKESHQIGASLYNSKAYQNKDFLRDYDAALVEFAKHFRICCFTRTARNTMMWSHYADKYEGVVFQFRTSEMKDSATGTFKGRKVEYPQHRVDLTDHVNAMKKCFDHGQPEEMAWIFGIKGHEWRGEEEVRFFAPANRSFLTFQENALTGIILGQNCSSKLEHDLISATREWNQPPRFFRTNIERSKFKLYIEKA